MKILVTGASGFIGSELVEALKNQGHEVWSMARYVSGRFDFYDKEHVVFADLRDRESLFAAVRHIQPEVIFNLAAMSAVSYSFDHAEEVMDVTGLGAMRMADAAREVGAWIIQASSSEVYGRLDSKIPQDEHQWVGGTSPYAVAKILAEEYLRVCGYTYKQPFTIVRPFNTIGRAKVKNSHFVVERAITQALTTGKIQLHDKRPFRDFLFRTDHVGAYLAVLANKDKALDRTFNFCTGDAWSIDQMAFEVGNYISDQFKKRPPVQIEFSATPDRPLDIARLQGTNARAKTLLGWTPQFSIQAGIHQAIEEWASVLGIQHPVEYKPGMAP